MAWLSPDVRHKAQGIAFAVPFLLLVADWWGCIAVCPHSAAACKRIGGLLCYVHHFAAVSAFVGGRAERSAFLSLRLRRERAMIEALSEGGKNAER